MKPNKKQVSAALGIPIPAFFLLLLVFQLFFMPGLMKQGGQLYVPFKKIVVGGSPNNPPFEFLDENNEPAGYNVDLTRAIASEMRIDVEIRLGEREVIEKAFIDGKIDILQGINQSNILAKRFLFHSQIVYGQKLFSVREYPENVRSLEQLNGGTVVLSGTTPSIETFPQLYPRLDFMTVSSHSEALMSLLAGDADYALIVNLPSLYLNRELSFLEQEHGPKKIVKIGEIEPLLGYGYVARDEDMQMLDSVSNSLNNLQLNGRLKEIQEQWLGKINPSLVSKRDKSVQLGGLVFSPLLLVACSVFFWNRSLAREVERRTKELAIQHQQLIQADKMTSLGILVAGVAHEINNPTGLILHNLSTLKRVYGAAESLLEEKYEREGDFFIGGLAYSVYREESPEIFEEMQMGAQRITQIVEDLKDFSRKDSTLLTEVASLNDVVIKSLRLVESSLEGESEVHLDLLASLPPFRGNSHRIEQVVINLIMNGVQASAETKQDIFIRTSFNEKSKEIVLFVEDHGVGISADKLPLLFAPFYTTKREKGGTGLGLSISEKIVKEHGGRLLFESQVGVGTTVSMYLPMNEED